MEQQQRTTSNRVPRPTLSLVQFLIATLPILVLLLYFLIAAHRRLSLPIYNLSSYTYKTRQQILTDFHDNILADGLLALPDMMYIYWMVFLGSSSLFAYMVYFIPSRRHLMMRYLAKKPISATLYQQQQQQQQQQQEKDTMKNNKKTKNEQQEEEGGDCLISLLGNVAYYPPTGFFYKYLARCYHADYAILTYEYPQHLLSTSSASPAQGGGSQEKEQEENNTNHTRHMVEKRIRTFHPYHREKITVVLLSPTLLKSGLPLSDVQHDVATFTKNIPANTTINSSLGESTSRRKTKELQKTNHNKNNNGDDVAFQYHEFPSTTTTSSLRKQQLGKDQTSSLLYITLLWMIFTLLGSIYMLHQIKALYYQLQEEQKSLQSWYYNNNAQNNDDNTSSKYHGATFFNLQNDWDLNYFFCRKMFYILFCLVTPLIALGGNGIAWWNYSHGIVHRGTVTTRISDKAHVPNFVTKEELQADDDGPRYFCDRYPTSCVV